MKVENATIEGLRAVAQELGVKLVERESKDKGVLNVLMRPAVGSNTYRAMSTAGAVKNSLCHHGMYGFMSRVFARFPEAVLETWYNKWDYTLFQAGARAWTENQIKAHALSDTCDCTPEMVEAALLSPDELRAQEGEAAHA